MLSPQIRFSNPFTDKHGRLSDAMSKVSKDVILASLRRYDWNKTKSAKELGLSRWGLRNKMKNLGISWERPKE